MQNPYDVDGKPIVQFKLESSEWYEGYGACREDDFEFINSMHEVLRKAISELRKAHNEYVQLMSRGVDGKT